MRVLITGGACSGKSFTGEQLAEKLWAKRRYYFATMRVFSKEDQSRVARHRRRRAGKGYITRETPVDILKQSTPDLEGTAFIDCLGNLWANENYENKKSSKKVAQELYRHSGNYRHTVWITNDVFLSGEEYSGETKVYMEGLGYINGYLAEKSDIVLELCCGIPIVFKGKELYHEIIGSAADCGLHVYPDSCSGGGVE